MKDPIRCPGAPEKWIERSDANGVPSGTFQCGCGATVGYPDCLTHDCDWTAHDPDDNRCDECGRFRGCTCR